MDPLKVAARFIAFTCFLNADADEPASPQEAGRYARQNWSAYLRYASEELGKHLTEKRTPPAPVKPCQQRRTKSPRNLAAAS